MFTCDELLKILDKNYQVEVIRMDTEYFMDYNSFFINNIKYHPVEV